VIKKKQTRKQSLTLDDFAALIQKDLARMVTKKDITAVTSDITVIKDDLVAIRNSMATREELKEVRDDVKQITDLMVSKMDLAETLRTELAESEYSREVSELRTRVERLEDKLGTKHARRAA
jgi:hypothetical protein